MKQRFIRTGDTLDNAETVARGGELDAAAVRKDALRMRDARTMRSDAQTRGTTMSRDRDIDADLNAQDDDGLGWSTLADARDPSQVKPGAMLLAGSEAAEAVVRVVAVDDDGQIHFTVLPGSVAKNRHLLARTVA